MRRGNTTASWTRGPREVHQRQWRNERWRCWQMGGSSVRRGNVTTSQTRGTGGHDTMRGNGRMRFGDAGRWEVAA